MYLSLVLPVVSNLISSFLWGTCHSFSPLSLDPLLFNNSECPASLNQSISEASPWIPIFIDNVFC